jgi:hypothetical protein
LPLMVPADISAGATTAASIAINNRRPLMLPPD